MFVCPPIDPRPDAGCSSLKKRNLACLPFSETFPQAGLQVFRPFVLDPAEGTAFPDWMGTGGCHPGVDGMNPAAMLRGFGRSLQG